MNTVLLRCTAPSANLDSRMQSTLFFSCFLNDIPLIEYLLHVLLALCIKDMKDTNAIFTILSKMNTVKNSSGLEPHSNMVRKMLSCSYKMKQKTKGALYVSRMAKIIHINCMDTFKCFE